MACYDPSQLGYLLKNWGSGNLNNILDHGHAIAGVQDVVATGQGLVAIGLCQRYTLDEIDAVMAKMLGGEHQLYAHLLICKYLLNWTMERLARALGHSCTSLTYSHVMVAEDIFAAVLLNAD